MKQYLDLCKAYREESSVSTVKDLQNEEIVSKDGYADSGKGKTKAGWRKTESGGREEVRAYP